VRKSPEIIEAHDVIGVRMCKNDRINTVNILAERLCSEIGPGVHHKRALGRFHIDRGAQPLIPRVRRAADFAIAANHRHALRRAGAKKGEREL
jgi:hypothetical protein